MSPFAPTNSPPTVRSPADSTGVPSYFFSIPPLSAPTFAASLMASYASVRPEVGTTSPNLPTWRPAATSIAPQVATSIRALARSLRPSPPLPLPTLPPAVRVERMLGIVRKVAARMSRKLPSHIDREDLLAAGAVGLVGAMQRRGTMPGIEFETFAEFRIRGAMLDELRRLDNLSRGTRSWATRIARARRTIENRNAACASDADLVAELGVDQETFHAVQANIDAARAPQELSTTDTQTEDGHELTAAAPLSLLPDAQAIRAEVQARLVAGMASLPERMRQVVAGVYVESRTLKEIAATMGVTESRVCQIHREAITRLRARMVSERAPARCQ